MEGTVLAHILGRWAILAKLQTTVTHNSTFVLARWAMLGRQSSKASEPDKAPWMGVQRLIAGARHYARSKTTELAALLAQSEELLHPLHDPLHMTFGLHRWLANDREEAYSDWLAWVFTELATPARIAHVLYGDSIGAEGEPLLAVQAECTADREVWVRMGHTDHAGRLDCVLCFGEEAILVIEVKVGSAEAADTAKQAGYSRWLKEHTTPWKKAFLLATDGKAQNYEGFTLILWQDVCERLRGLLPQIIAEKRIPTAALIAAFVGAVEQNLLGFPHLVWAAKSDASVHALGQVNRLEAVTRYLRNVVGCLGGNDESK